MLLPVPDMDIGASSFKDVLLVEFMYLVFTCMPGESYCGRLRSFVVAFVRLPWNAN